MSEIADKELTFKDYVAVFKRRGNLFFWITGPLLTAGIAVAFGLPAVYESYAILLAEQQEVPEYDEFLSRALDGETVVSPPFPGVVMMETEGGKVRMGEPTMFVCAPVRGRSLWPRDSGG